MAAVTPTAESAGAESKRRRENEERVGIDPFLRSLNLGRGERAEAREDPGSDPRPVPGRSATGVIGPLPTAGRGEGTPGKLSPHSVGATPADAPSGVRCSWTPAALRMVLGRSPSSVASNHRTSVPSNSDSFRAKVRRLYHGHQAARGNRTPDLLITNQLLSRLSYGGIRRGPAPVWTHLGLLLNPHDRKRGTHGVAAGDSSLKGICTPIPSAPTKNLRWPLGTWSEPRSRGTDTFPSHPT